MTTHLLKTIKIVPESRVLFVFCFVLFFFYYYFFLTRFTRSPMTLFHASACNLAGEHLINLTSPLYSLTTAMACHADGRLI